MLKTTRRRLSVKLDRMGTDAIREIGEIVLREMYAARTAKDAAVSADGKACMAECEAALVAEYRKLERFLDK